MNKTLTGLTFAAPPAIAGPAQAALNDLGNGLVNDTTGKLMRHLATAFTAVLSLSIACPILAVPLNDTGQTDCYDENNVVADCATVATDTGSRPRQDARFGRDPAFADGEYAKTGGGAAGFDYTKICMSGEEAGTGSCPADPAVGTDPNQWACTRDNHTNLVWSVETPSYVNWTAATTTLPGSYDTAGRCGFSSGWRAPTRRELLSIVHHGTNSPAIDGAYFPNTNRFHRYWSTDEYEPATGNAWLVEIADGGAVTYAKTYASGAFAARLVHGAQ